MNQRFLFSFVNLCTGVTATSEDTDFPASNLLRPDTPFMPWKSTSTSAQTLSFTLSGSASFVLLVGANFSTATVNAAPITLARNPFNWRYQHAMTITPASSVTVVASGTPTDGADHFRLGGVWAGTYTHPPMNPRFDVDPRTLIPELDVRPDHDGWKQRLRMGRPRAEVTITRMARLTKLSPGTGDHLQQWSEIDRQCWESDAFALWYNLGDASHAFIMRRVGDIGWSRNRVNLAEGRLVLEEVVAR